MPHLDAGSEKMIGLLSGKGISDIPLVESAGGIIVADLGFPSASGVKVYMGGGPGIRAGHPESGVEDCIEIARRKVIAQKGIQERSTPRVACSEIIRHSRRGLPCSSERKGLGGEMILRYGRENLAFAVARSSAIAEERRESCREGVITAKACSIDGAG